MLLLARFSSQPRSLLFRTICCLLTTCLWSPGSGADASPAQCPEFDQRFDPPAAITEPPGEEMQASARHATHTEGLVTRLEGDVEITKKSWKINSDLAWIDEASGDFKIEGAVTIQEPGLIITGDQASGNLNVQRATVNAASFLLSERQLSGKAERITTSTTQAAVSDTSGDTPSDTPGDTLHDMTGANRQWVLDTSEFTSCEPDHPAWVIKSKSVLIKSGEGYGTARHVSLRFKGVPLMYSPYFRFPTSDQRQSGFLTPSIGRSSDGGADLALPWYFNLAPRYDATYTLRSIWQRGLMHEGELRHLGPLGETLVGGAFLSEDDQYQHTEPLPGTDARGNNETKKQDRWFTRVVHRGGGGAWVSQLHYTRVSDLDYLDDFGSHIGATNSLGNGALDFATGASSVSGASQPPALRQTASLSYTAQHWRGILELQDFQTLSHDEHYATLPRFSLEYAKQHAAFAVKSRLQVARYRKDQPAMAIPAAGSASLINTSLINNSVEKGSRLVFDGELSLPLHRPWGFFTPALGIIHRRYQLGDDLRDALGTRARITTGRLSVDAGLVFERHKTLWGKAVYQTMKTRIHYLYLEEKFQNHLPSFDSVAMTPSLAQAFRTNRFTGYDRLGDAKQVALGISTDISSAQTGARLFSAGLGQIFYFKDREVVLDNGFEVDRRADSSPLFAQIEMHLAPAFTLRTAFEWRNRSGKDPGKTNRNHLTLKYRAQKGSIFNLYYAYAAKQRHRRMGTSSMEANSVEGSKRAAEEADLSFILPATPAWSVIGRWHYSLDRNQTLESLFGVEYKDCCWTLRLLLRRYLDAPRGFNTSANTATGPIAPFNPRAKRGIFFEFQLKGLTSLGSRLDPLLEDAIPGYSNL